jgi:hypothetical protein
MQLKLLYSQINKNENFLSRQEYKDRSTISFRCHSASYTNLNWILVVEPASQSV